MTRRDFLKNCLQFFAIAVAASFTPFKVFKADDDEFRIIVKPLHIADIYKKHRWAG